MRLVDTSTFALGTLTKGVQMMRTKHTWFIGINPVKKIVEIHLSDSKNLDQVRHLECVDMIIATKIPRGIVKMYKRTLRLLYPE